METGTEETVAEVRREVPWRSTGLALAWAVILGVGILHATRGVFRPEESYRQTDEAATVLRMPEEAYRRIELVVRREKTAAWAVGDMAVFEGGSTARRLRFAAFVGTLQGAKLARERLRDLDSRLASGELTASPEEVESRRTLGAIYDDPVADSPGGIDRVVARLPPAESESLRRNLGWFGRLALEPVGDPGPSIESLRWSSLVNRILFHAGIVLLVIVVPLLLYLRVFRSGIGAALSWHGVLAESAAVLLLAEIVVPSGLLPSGRAAHRASSDLMDLLAVGIAISWPLLRRVRIEEILRSFGWTRGSGLGREIAIGLLAFPLLDVGREFLSFILPRGVHHASASDLDLASGAPWPMFLTAFGLITVTPMVEELCFRGLLYRYLRDSLRGFSAIGGVVLGIAVTGLLFAAGHRGGPSSFAHHFLFAAMAALLYEWRGSLWAPMALHFATNLRGLIATLLVGA